jgi:hypothetical protein
MEELALFILPDNRAEALDSDGDIGDEGDGDASVDVMSSSSNNSSPALVDANHPEFPKELPNPNKVAKGKARLAQSNPGSQPARSGGTLSRRSSFSDVDGKLTFLYVTSYDFIWKDKYVR